MIDEASDSEIRHWRLVSYFHDCLAAQSDWARAVNIITQRDLTTLPLSAEQQHRLGIEGQLSLSDAQAIDLSKRVAVSGDRMALFLGTLFLVGSIPATDDQKSRKYCAPLLEVPLDLRAEGDLVVVTPQESEFTVNYSLVGELLGGDADDLQDRLADLAQSVPDFPIDATEFQAFWERFRLIAPEVPISHERPDRRKSDPAVVSSNSESRSDKTRSDLFEMVDFYLPRIPDEPTFRLLPATAVLFGPKAGGAMSALSELRMMREMSLTRTAFGSVFDPASAESHPPRGQRHFRDEVHPLPLSPTQSAIVQSARQAPLTVVTGPPGTGKSYTITAIVLDALLRGETVLVSSQMDKAVEVVADHVEAVAGPLAIARSGGRAAQRQLAKKVSRFTGPRSGLGQSPDHTIEQSEQKHTGLSQQQQQLEQDFGRLVEAECSWSECFSMLERSRPLLKFPPADVADGDVRKANRLLERVKTRLNEGPGKLGSWLNWWDLSRVRRLLKLPAESQPIPADWESLIQFHLLQLRMHEIEHALHAPLPSDQAATQIAQVEQQKHQTAIQWLQLIRKQCMRALVSDPSSRTALRDLAAMLRRRKEELKLQLQQSLTAELLLDAFPAWACTSRSLCEILPTTPGLFDLVVIDEASQCDLALASVALMRGRRAVVVGDPHQLRHVSFLSRAREQASFVRHDVSPDMQRRFHYRRSLFDVAADNVSSQHFFFLDEHFRSHPHIISFSNRKFYENGLSIMTGRPSSQPQAAIRLLMVGGQRDSDSSINRIEIDAILQIVSELIASDGKCSIGIVSRFRDHADAIKERLVREQPAEVLTRHQIVVGTAHSLQGDEKDVVILSTSIDSNAHPASLRFLESPNLFNVAITRARRELVVISSVSADDLPVGLLREFLVYAGCGWSTSEASEPTDCRIEQAIATRLQQNSLDCWTGFHCAGTRVDVVAAGTHRSVAILCDRAGMTDWRTSLEAQRRLTRAGWVVRRLSHRAVEQHWDACQQAICESVGD